jgi:hypothetical protein
MLHDHRIAPATCPYCEKLLDGASGLDHDSAPSPDDFTVCIYCAQILRFKNDMSLRKVTPYELQKMSRKEPRLRASLELMAWAVRCIDRRGPRTQ